LGIGGARNVVRSAGFLPDQPGTGLVMGLLTAPLTLVRAPLRITLRVWEYGLSSAAEAARLGFEILDQRRSAAPGFEPPRPPARRDHTGNGAPSEPAAPDAPPAVPDELLPDHVDEEPVLVAEVAEEGAEEGAGPELHVDPPWDGYDQMTAADIRDRLTGASATEAAAVELYESTGKNRRTVIEAAERALRP
jgi:hypothetical protein